jgi:excisionase family DNA binding protein
MPVELLSAPAAARLLGVSDETLRRWAADGRIRHIRMPSGQLRFRPADIAAILEPVEPGDGRAAS